MCTNSETVLPAATPAAAVVVDFQAILSQRRATAEAGLYQRILESVKHLG
jgi:hypothetical protein